MFKPIVLTRLAMIFSGLSLPLCAAAQATLTPPEQRITDAAIHADYKGYEVQQAAIKALNDTGHHRIASYSLSKAQCWLDVSFHEYTRNDRSAFPEQALQESMKITSYLQAGGAVDGPDNPARLTPLVNDATRLREDLWAAALAARTSPDNFCAAQLSACGEVELVHAGNEFKQQGWRHAKPYIQIAEDRIGDAQAAAAQCLPPAVASTPAPEPVEPMVVAAPAAPAEVELSANVLFNFDRSDIGNVRPLTKHKLDDLIEQLTGGNVTVQAITLTGHADRSNHTGQSRYNLQLSIARADTIKAYLQAHGIDTSKATVHARADAIEVAPCRDPKLDRAALEECLLPNRRVEVSVMATRIAKTPAP
ncbi:MAG TPA: OmpA family protein [Burkholderiaceae bacterium]|jgi:outer membrane protein OmpA-like peptidoglycan-associated protein